MKWKKNGIQNGFQSINDSKTIKYTSVLVSINPELIRRRRVPLESVSEVLLRRLSPDAAGSICQIGSPFSFLPPFHCPTSGRSFYSPVLWPSADSRPPRASITRRGDSKGRARGGGGGDNPKPGVTGGEGHHAG